MISRQALDTTDFAMLRSREERRPRQLGLLKVAGIIIAFFAAAVSAASAQTFTTLYSFAYASGGQFVSVQGTDGNFYGTIFGQMETNYDCGGTSYPCGTVFKIDAGGNLTALHSFNFTDGGLPTALIQGTSANFYGTTKIGGTGTPCSFTPTPGTIFTLTADGTLATLHDFDCTDGASPTGILQGAGGNLYGTTASGGDGCVPAGCGTVFKITPSGTLTTLHFFDGTDGSAPVGLLQGSDGNFYGMAGGTFFKITPSGTFTALKSSCACGGALVEGSDGNFYGVTYSGGANSGGAGSGTVFKITTTGTLTTLYSFCPQTNCTDGWGPVGGLIQGSDGNFYGTTAYGGTGVCGESGCGTIFKITPSGNLTTLYNFCSQANCADGNTPEAALLQAADRVFYGTTTQGGAHNGGTFFSLSAGLNGATASSISVNLSLSNIVAGSSGPVVMTATVSPVSGSGTPSGTIAFFNGSTYVGTSAVTVGVATYDYNPSSLSANTYQITAAYSGDSTFAGSNSPAQTLTVASAPNPDYQLSVNPSALNIMAGQSGKAVFTVTPENGFDTQVSFACSGLPAGATCTFDPANLTPSNSNPVTSTLTITTTAASAILRGPKPFVLWPIYAFLAPTAGMLFRMGTRRRRLIRGSRFLNAAALLLMLASLTSCGSSSKATSLITSPQASIVTVTASTSGTGAINHTATLTITITPQ